MAARRGRIRRIDLPARHVTSGVDSRNRPTGRVYVDFIAENCSIQPYVGADLLTLEEGYRTSDIQTLFTDTPLEMAVEGSDANADEVEIRSKWYKVVKVKAWQNGIIPHYECVVVKIDEVLNG